MNGKRSELILKNDKALVLYDGQCGLCDGLVQFLLKHDTKNNFQFAALQSDAGIHYCQRYGIANDIDSAVVIYHEQAFIYADAALKIAQLLPMPYKIARIGIIVPTALRNQMYKFVAKHRLRFFGTVDTCRLPTPLERAKFLS